MYLSCLDLSLFIESCRKSPMWFRHWSSSFIIRLTFMLFIPFIFIQQWITAKSISILYMLSVPLKFVSCLSNYSSDRVHVKDIFAYSIPPAKASLSEPASLQLISFTIMTNRMCHFQINWGKQQWQCNNADPTAARERNTLWTQKVSEWVTVWGEEAWLIIEYDSLFWLCRSYLSHTRTTWDSHFDRRLAQVLLNAYQGK